MGTSDKRSRLSIDISTQERLWLKMLAASQNRSINDLVLSCIREHLPCRLEHISNAKTAADLDESEKDQGAISFCSPQEMFKYLGLPMPCLNQSSPKTSSATSKRPSAKKKM